MCDDSQAQTQRVLKEKKHGSEWIINIILTCIIKLTELCKPLLLTVQYFRGHGNEVNAFFLGYVLFRYLHNNTFTVVLLCHVCLCLMFGVLSLSEYLMKPWQALHCCSSGHRVSGKKTPSLVLPSVGINKEGLKPPATIQGCSMLAIKANPSLCCCKTRSPPARLNGRCWKKCIIPCTVMLIPQLNYSS